MYLWLATVSQAAPVAVTTLAEPGVSDDGQCTLSEAIDFVRNGTADKSGCTGDKYPDEITFPGLSGTITLADDVPTLDPTLGAMTLTGPGADVLTIDLAGHRGFLTSRQGVSIIMRGLTVTGGDTTRSGGALFVDATDTVVVEDCVFTGNTTTSNGGAIASSGTLTLTRVHLFDNTTTGTGISQGAGVWSNGVLSIVDSAIVGNTAAAQGGGVFVGAHGTATITNSTLSGNQGRQGGGLATVNAFGAKPGPTTTVISSTIHDNRATDSGGGVVVSGTGGRAFLVMGRTVVAGNTSKGLSPDCDNGAGASGSITSLGYNLIGIGERCAPEALIKGDAAGTLKAPVDAGLDPLASPGAALPTHHPAGTSPTIDAVPGAACVDALGVALAADQRGFTRPTGAGCEIGAHEIGCGDGVLDQGEECDTGAAYDPACVDCLIVDQKTTPKTTDTGPAETADTGTEPNPTPTGDTGTGGDESAGCGCQGAPGGLLLWLPVGLLLRRRRTAR